MFDVSSKYALVVEEVVCESTTSADDAALREYRVPCQELDRIACRTLRSCMQDVFEDGPKRGRRLWIADLRLQALTNYATYRNNDLVKRCLYLFAGSTFDDGQVSACIFTEPAAEADDTQMFDYSLLFIPTPLDYYRATSDRETLAELYPTVLRQISGASQVWMILGGAAEPADGAAILQRMEQIPDAEGMVTPYMMHYYVDVLLQTGREEKALDVMQQYWGGMADDGTDTFWEMYNPKNPAQSPYGGTIVNSCCHAWSCGPACFLRERFCIKENFSGTTD